MIRNVKLSNNNLCPLKDLHNFHLSSNNRTTFSSFFAFFSKPQVTDLLSLCPSSYWWWNLRFWTLSLSEWTNIVSPSDRSFSDVICTTCFLLVVWKEKRTGWCCDHEMHQIRGEKLKNHNVKLRLKSNHRANTSYRPTWSKLTSKHCWYVLNTLHLQTWELVSAALTLNRCTCQLFITFFYIGAAIQVQT